MNFYHLPKQYRGHHESCFVIHDHLAHMLQDYTNADAFMREYSLLNEAEKQSFLQDEWAWLESSGNLHEVLFNRIVPSLTEDTLHFVYTGLECAAKAKVAVAYNLFRKPFYDNLFFFEWMVADPDDFLINFQKSAESVDAVHCDAKKTGKRKKLIEDTLCRISQTFPDAISPLVLNAEWLYDVRYNKDCTWGFQREWNTATHLITTNKKWTTEPMNFNFIFAGNNEIDGLWQHLYNKLPLLLTYAAETILVAFNRVSTLNPDAVEEFQDVFVSAIRNLSIDAGFDLDACLIDELRKAHQSENASPNP